jgi:hypothetical protein
LRKLIGIDNAFRELEAIPGELKEKAGLDPQAELNRRGRMLRVVFGRNLMATTSFTTLRRFAGYAFTLMLISMCLTGLASGQGSPLVTASSAAGLSHPTGWGTIEDSAIDQAGDWFVVDYANGGLYEFPANGGAAIVLGSVSPSASLGGGYQNPVITIDPGNNIYIGANWNNCLLMFPWNATTKTWTGLNDGGPNDLSPSKQQRPDRRRARRLPRRSCYDYVRHGRMVRSGTRRLDCSAGPGIVGARDCRCGGPGK